MIVKNSIITPDGTELVSKHVHDFNGYEDKNGKFYAVDGGKEYLRRACDEQDYEETSVYYEDPHDKVREAFTWGTYGKNGDQPRQDKLLKDLDTDHIEAILKTQHQIPTHVREMFETELGLR